MSFNIALTGINSSSTQLDVIGHNIANSSTTGFKSSRAEFADLYSSVSSSVPVGSGSTVGAVTQSFEQGSISFSSNSLDLAINGNGFFQLSEQGSSLYTRSGAFFMDRDGNIVNSAEQNLQGYNVDANGDLLTVSADLQVSTANAPPSTTDVVALNVNLDAIETPPAAGSQFIGGSTPATNTYAAQSSVTVYDSLGTAHVLTTFFIKADNDAAADASIASTPLGQDNQWYMAFQIDGNDLYDIASVDDGTGTPVAATNQNRLPRINFNSDGTYSSIAVPANTNVGAGFPPTPIGNGLEISSGQFQLTYDPGNGASVMTFSLDFNDASLGGSTQFGSGFAVQGIEQDGYSTGRLDGLEVSSDGVISGRYSNGKSLTLGQVLMASFVNESGLIPSGDTAWIESADSGQPLVGTANTGRLGSITGGGLESSTVDLTAQLVALITAQRDFQANAKTIETEDAVIQVIMNQ